MKKLQHNDIGFGYFEHHISFAGLDSLIDDEDNNHYSVEGLSEQQPKLLTLHELTTKYDLSGDVAVKFINMQAEVINGFRDSTLDMVVQADRYFDVKPYLRQKNLSHQILSEYVHCEWDHEKMLKEFNPSTHLRNGIIGTSLSCVIFVGLVVSGWNAQPPTGFDFLSLGLIAFVWLGITLTVAWHLPSEYRARKIVYGIVKNKDKRTGTKGHSSKSS